MILLTAKLVVGQGQLDTELKRRLDSIMALDQKYREMMSLDNAKKLSLAKQFGIPADSLNRHLWKLQQKSDSSNWAEIESIFIHQGYPGKSLVGEPTNEAAWYVLQHNTPNIQKYFPLVETAGKNGELPFMLVAKMQDRLLMMQNQEQIYGTQAVGLTLLNPKTGNKEFQWVMWPIRDRGNVNQRRKEAGFRDTVEENAHYLEAEFKDLTVSEINDIQGGKH
ncbi:hypothetical protein [Flavihumibacter petaseus]|nr:hypothetical protein [Flavihumibacter petaseus]